MDCYIFTFLVTMKEWLHALDLQTGVSPLVTIYCHTKDTSFCWWGAWPFCKGYSWWILIPSNKATEELGRVCLFGFYGKSTFVSFLMPNQFLYKCTVLFQTIQLSIYTQFNCQKHFYFKQLSRGVPLSR